MKSSKSSRRRKSARQWVVEIGTSHVAAGLFTQRDHHRELQYLRHVELALDEGGESVAFAGMERALGELQSDRGIRGEVVLVVPGHLALCKQVKVPVVAEEQRPKLIEFEVRQAIPFDLDQVYWAHRERGIHEGELDVMIVAAKTDGIDRLLQVCASVGLAVKAVMAAGPTLLSLVGQAEGSSALISVGARATHLVFKDGERVHLRTLTLAGNSVTHDIANRLDQSFAEAEQLKRGIGSGKISLPEETRAGEAVKEATASFGARLKQEISRTLVTQMRPAGIAPPRQTRLAGGGVQGLPTGLNFGAAESEPSSEWSLPADLVVTDDAAREVSRVGAGRIADMIGAYFSASERGGYHFDLAPPRMREARAAQRQRPRWIMAASLLVVATFLPGLHFNRLAAARMESTEELRRQTVPVQVLQNQVTSHLDELAHLRDEAGVWQEQLQSRHAWEGLMADLQSSLGQTGDVWLERLQALPMAEAAEDRLRLRISGRLLDRENPLTRVSQNSYQRATALLVRFVESPRITAIEGERFDASEPGMLRFDFTLVINPRAGL